VRGQEGVSAGGAEEPTPPFAVAVPARIQAFDVGGLDYGWQRIATATMAYKHALASFKAGP
jgi:acetoacetate decarboxylase